MAFQVDVSDHFRISWQYLSYLVYNDLSCTDMLLRARAVPKVIFDGLSGHFESGQLTAVVGPSGAGKTTLLECLIGLRDCYGQVLVEGTLNKISVAYVPQFDQFYEMLTSRECIEFAVKVYCEFSFDDNSTPANYKRQIGTIQANIVTKILKRLRLEDCADTTIKLLSGGQRKRLSIAQELIRTPNIIILDEPTTGLDSSTSMQLVELLNQLTKEHPATAIVASIHQPSYRIINNFDRIYALSNDGRCVFTGHPGTLLFKLKSIGEGCENNNPVDVLIEVSAGCCGQYKLDALVKSAQIESNVDSLLNDKALVHRTSLRKATHVTASFNIQKFYALIIRNYRTALRDPMLMPLRFLLPIVAGICVAISFGDVADIDGCPPDIPQLLNKMSFSGEVDFERFTSMKMEMKERHVMEATNQVFLLCCAGYVFMMAALPAVLSFPTELFLFDKETKNGAYTPSMYYVANLIGSVPLSLINCTIFTVLAYAIIGYPNEGFRFGYFLLIMVLNALISETLGLLIGCMLTKSPKTAIFAAPLSLIPLFIFSGHVINIELRPPLYEFLSRLSFVRHTMDGLHIALYGFRRCTSEFGAFKLIQRVFKAGIRMSIMDASEFGFRTNFFEVVNNSLVFAGKAVVSSQALENIATELVFGSVAGDIVVNEYGHVESSQVRFFHLKDNDLWRALNVLVAQLIVFRIVSYYLIVIRGRKS